MTGAPQNRFSLDMHVFSGRPLRHVQYQPTIRHPARLPCPSRFDPIVAPLSAVLSRTTAACLRATGLHGISPAQARCLTATVFIVSYWDDKGGYSKLLDSAKDRMSITRSIEIVPAIRRVKLLHVGCWEQLDLEFVPGLNIITEESSAWGKTTIFRAILQALLPSTQREYPLSVTHGFLNGTISIELMSPTISVRLGALEGVSPEPAMHESQGQFMLRLLRSHLDAAPPDAAILAEEEVTSVLDMSAFPEAVTLLNGSHCQVICQIAHNLNLKDFPAARVYTGSLDHANKPRMRLQQPGRGDALTRTPSP